MLIGIPPFYHRNQELMIDLIKTSDIKFPSFIQLSENCQDFMRKVYLYIRKYQEKYKFIANSC